MKPFAYHWTVDPAYLPPRRLGRKLPSFLMRWSPIVIRWMPPKDFFCNATDKEVRADLRKRAKKRPLSAMTNKDVLEAMVSAFYNDRREDGKRWEGGRGWV